ncbi:MAG: hypothetical protein P1T08_11790 [Acidimicrobiia bacterium]|nr:hypothetical protein [Acidimicrobiia bacterium]
MGDLRLINQTGLYRVASRLDEATGELQSSARALMTVLETVPAVLDHTTALHSVAAALEAAAADLRRRRLEEPPTGPFCEAPTIQIDQRPVGMVGFEGSSEAWGVDAVDDRGRWLRDSVIRGEWSGRVAARHTDIHGPLGTFSASALTAESRAEGWIGFDDWALELGGGAEVALQLAQVEYGLDTAYVDVSSEAFVGGEASAFGYLDLGFVDGDAGFEGGVDAFVGMAATAELGMGTDTVGLIAGGEVGIGFGVDADLAVGYDDGVASFDFGASAFLGLGGGVDMSFDVDLAAIGKVTVDVIEGASTWIGSLWP